MKMPEALIDGRYNICMKFIEPPVFIVETSAHATVKHSESFGDKNVAIHYQAVCRLHVSNNMASILVVALILLIHLLLNVATIQGINVDASFQAWCVLD